MSNNTAREIALKLRATRADMIGTDDEQHYWDCHAAADAIDQLDAILEGRFKEAGVLTALEGNGTSLRVAIDQSIIGQLFASFFLSILKAEDAPNFVQCEAMHPEEGPLTFTVERRNGRSPAVQLAEAKARIAELEAQIDDAAMEAREADRWVP